MNRDSERGRHILKYVCFQIDNYHTPSDPVQKSHGTLRRFGDATFVKRRLLNICKTLNHVIRNGLFFNRTLPGVSNSLR